MDIGKIVKEDVEATWEKIPGSDAEVCVRRPKPKRVRQIIKSCTKRRLVKGKYINIRDDDRMNQMLMDECVVDWKKIEMDGKPLEVTIENKTLLDDNWTQFSDTWNAAVSDEVAAYEALEEEQRGNSDSGPGGTS